MYFESDRIARIFSRYYRPPNAIKVTFRDLAIKIAVTIAEVKHFAEIGSIL